VTNDEIGRAFVACEQWRWMAGMVGPGYVRLEALTNRIPDVTDPATRGCILALVRELWQAPNAYTCTEYGHWHVSSGEDCAWELQAELSSDGFSRYPTEIEALLAAVQGAPVVP